MKILYYNNCWFTNVGEAFIDIGAMELIKQIFPDSKVACVSDMTNYYCNKVNGKKIPLEMYDCKMIGDWYKYLECDYIILSGMFASELYLKTVGCKMIDYFKNSGSKVIFLGLGAQEYTEKERGIFYEYLSKLNPYIVVTRDNKTYDMYKDCCKRIIKGIDCAFWVRDVFDPKGFTNKKYDIISFNRSKEPIELSNLTESVIRPWHMQDSFKKDKFNDQIMISDTPYDYLTLYANANKVYTDLVHATIISLMYEVPVKYWYVDERCTAFKNLCGIVNKDGWLTMPVDNLVNLKKQIVLDIKKLL